MSGWVAVLVDNKELVRFARLGDGASGALNLTTMLADQDRASVEIHLVNGGNSTRIHTFSAEGIRRDGRRPEIVVSAHVRTTLHVSLRVDGELVGSAEFAIPAAMTAFRPGPLIAAVLVLLTVLGLGWGVWWAFSNIDAPAPRERVAELVVPASDPDPGAAAQTPPSAQRPDPTTPDHPAAELEATVLFEPERAELLPPAREALDRIADALERWVSAGGDPESIRIELVGHTALYGNEEARVALSDERARAAAEYLAERLQERGIEVAELSVAGRGGREPVTRAEPDQWRNRRVEIDITAGNR